MEAFFKVLPGKHALYACGEAAEGLLSELENLGVVHTHFCLF
jgi:hypothetical protein